MKCSVPWGGIEEPSAEDEVLLKKQQLDFPKELSERRTTEGAQSKD